VYNEEECIEECVRQLRSVFVGDEFELILVNDGSTDKTLPLIEKNRSQYNLKVVSYPTNRGYASAVHEGLKAATKEYFNIFDADLQVKPSDVHLMYKTAVEQKLDFVVGEPKSKGYGLFRWLVSRGFNLLIRILFGINVRDTNSPKIVRRSMLKDVTLVYGHAMIDIEILAYAFRKKCSLGVVPFDIQKRFKGTSKFNLMLIPLTFIDLVRLKIRLSTGNVNG
jgi:glycosyltransferase involved in cell wall biosynthesis